MVRRSVSKTPRQVAASSEKKAMASGAEVKECSRTTDWPARQRTWYNLVVPIR